MLTIVFSLIIIQCSSETENKREIEKLDAAVKEFDSTDLKTTNIEVVAENNNFSLAYNFKEGKSLQVNNIIPFRTYYENRHYDEQSIRSENNSYNKVQHNFS